MQRENATQASGQRDLAIASANVAPSAERIGGALIL